MADKTPATAAADKPKRVQGPRPAYVMLRVPEGVDMSGVEVLTTTRKAEEALAMKDEDPSVSYIRVVVK